MDVRKILDFTRAQLDHIQAKPADIARSANNYAVATNFNEDQLALGAPTEDLRYSEINGADQNVTEF